MKTVELEWYLVLENGELKQTDESVVESDRVFFKMCGYGFGGGEIGEIQIFYTGGFIIYKKNYSLYINILSSDFRNGEETIKKRLLKAENSFIHKYEYGYYL